MQRRSEGPSYIVLGASLAGFAAALRLRKKGFVVRLYELLQDIPIRSAFAVHSPSENTEVPGADLESAFIEQIRQAGVQFGEREVEVTEWLEGQNDCHLALRSLGAEPERVNATAVVLAPNGVLPRSEYPAGWESLIGHGVSESVFSDGPFYRGKSACIYGCGLWAVDQARMLAQWASGVVHLCNQDSLSTLARQQDRGLSNVELWLRSKILALMPDSDQHLRGISIRQDGITKQISCSALFLAPEPKMDWRVLGRVFEDGGRIQSRRLFNAGIAGGITFGASSELFQNGIDVAEIAASL